MNVTMQQVRDLTPSSRMDWTVASILAVLVYYSCYYVSLQRRMKGSKQPPGPTGWPIFGVLFELLALNGYHVPALHAWAEQYGPITQIQIGSDKHIVISDDKIARELFIKRGEKYGDRYVTHAAGWSTMNENPALRLKDEGWRRERAFIHAAVSITANKKYQKLMEDEANLTLHYLIKAPKSSSDQFTRFAYSVLTTALMGFSITSAQDPYILQNEAFRRRFFDGFRLDLFPSNVLSIFRRLPNWLIPNFYIMETLRKENHEQMMSLRRKIEQSVADGTAGDCIYKHFLKNREEYQITDNELAFTFQAMIGAGTHNPHEALMTALSLLVEYPQWQQKLHAELDRVVGKDRMPTFEDIPQLPLVRAIVKEALRYRGAAREAGLPRLVKEDDFYGGYFFEKGSIFHINFDTILHDKDIYPDGEPFNPARYLEPSYPTYKEPLTVYPNCQNFSAFGYGKRICPGIDFGERTISIMLSKLGWAFDMKRPVDENGVEYQSPRIMDWKFRLELRDQKRSKVVKTAVEEAARIRPITDKASKEKTKLSE